jgi:hypothetical protein
MVGIAIGADVDKIYVKTGSGLLIVKPNPSTRIWKGEYGSKIDVIRPGDDLAMRGVAGPDGSFIPSEIWVNITILEGVVKSVKDNIIEVDAIRNDSVKETKAVKLTDGTLSTQDPPLRKDVVQVGRTVQVIGLALDDGSIQATRVRVYLNGRFLDATGTEFVDPRTGAIVDKR